MGNKISSDKSFGDIYILLNKSKYIAGEQVNGTVNLRLVKAFPSPEIYLVIQGKEKTKVIYQTTRKRNSKTNYIYLKKIFLTLYKFN